MKSTVLVLAAMLMLVPAAPMAVKAEPSKNPRVSNAALIAAARQATLKAIDYGSDYCDGDMSIDAWLKALVGKQARTITWTGGECELVNPYPGIDAAEWPYCAQAVITLKHPKSRHDRSVIEIYLETPVDGHPGAAYAFRSMNETIGYLRFRKEFEADWNERFPPAPTETRCQDE